MENKRKRLLIFSISIIVVIGIIVGAILYFNNLNNNENPDWSSQTEADGVGVHFLDVGQGDCIFIIFPDGKNFMIDTGLNDDVNQKYIRDFLTRNDIQKIDNLLLTHPDLDHIGNAQYILDNYQVAQMFVPYVNDYLLDSFNQFAHLKAILEKARQNGIDYKISDYTYFLQGQDYKLAFLSPTPSDLPESFYGQLNSMIEPDDKSINNTSTMVYLEFMGSRFLFTGDAQKAVEQFVISRYKSNFYNVIYLNKINVNLSQIDYLKLSHHGSDDASSQDFLNLLQPKNVIISVGANNFYGHPNSETLLRLDAMGIQYNLFRTDTQGKISVKLNGNTFTTMVAVS